MVAQLVVPLLLHNQLELLVSPWPPRQPPLPLQLVLLTLLVGKENKNAKMANGMITAIELHFSGNKIKNQINMFFNSQSNSTINELLYHFAYEN